jgi:CRISPR-associated protein Csb3
MKQLEPSLLIPVDPTNPGQFFACCGLLELTDRLRGPAEGWFDRGQFHVRAGTVLPALVDLGA